MLDINVINEIIRFRRLPQEIGQLAVLQWLNLNSNQLQSLPDNLRESILKAGNYSSTTKAAVLASQRKPDLSEEAVRLC